VWHACTVLIHPRPICPVCPTLLPLLPTPLTHLPTRSMPMSPVGASRQVGKGQKGLLPLGGRLQLSVVDTKAPSNHME